MVQLTIPKLRRGNDLSLTIRLTDSGVSVSWPTVQELRVMMYADKQSAMAGEAMWTIDSKDSTLLRVVYPASEPQYLGINKIVLACSINGMYKTYDAPVVCYVDASDMEGQTTVEVPTVELSAGDISSSLISAILNDCLKATESSKAQTAQSQKDVADMINRGNAAIADVTNTNAQVAQEESQRQASEDVRMSNEQDRQSHETARERAESQRRADEQKRIATEAARVEAELARQATEADRDRAEQQRTTDELVRKSSEVERRDAESARVASENVRQTNEDNRILAEAKRQTDTANAIKSVKDETATAIGNMKAESTSVLTKVQTDSQTAIDANNKATADAAEAATNIGINEYPEFTAIESYAVGDVVRYNGRLYCFVTAHPAGAWIGTDTEVTSLNAVITNEVHQIGCQVSELGKAQNWSDGFLIVNGTIDMREWCAVSDFIDCHTGDNVVWKWGNTYPPNQVFLVCYDEQKNVLSAYAARREDGDGTFRNFTITIDKCSFIRFSFIKADRDSCYFSINGVKVYVPKNNGRITALEQKVGDTTQLSTTAKTDLVAAINELKAQLSQLSAATEPALMSVRHDVDSLISDMGGGK